MGSGKEEGLVGSNGNYLLCVAEKEAVSGDDGSGVDCFDVKIGIVGVEISAGEVIHGEFNDNVMRSGLEAVVLSLSPAEILIGDPLSASTEKVFNCSWLATFALLLYVPKWSICCYAWWNDRRYYASFSSALNKHYGKS